MRKSIKSILAAFLAFFIISCTAVVVQAASYVGNSQSMKFHYTNCHTVKKINASNYVRFDNRESAVNAGYVPCKVCSP